MKFEVKKADNISVILAPRIELHDYLPLEDYADQMCKVVDENLASDIVMDLERVAFAGTPVLAALVRAHLAASRRQHKFAICNLTDFIKDVLHKVRLDRILMIFPTPEDAISAINAPGEFYTHK